MFKVYGKTELNNDHFGAGSVVLPDGELGPHLLVVSLDNTNVSFVNLKTFVLSRSRQTVGDCNHLSEPEARALVTLMFADLKLNSTFSDAHLIPKGIKKDK